ncbi:hypothetical protein [Methylomonas fluvii]|nr:hypothetical protein [Methylomonas fluvii]
MAAQVATLRPADSVDSVFINPTLFIAGMPFGLVEAQAGVPFSTGSAVFNGRFNI